MIPKMVINNEDWFSLICRLSVMFTSENILHVTLKTAQLLADVSILFEPFELCRACDQNILFTVPQ